MIQCTVMHNVLSDFCAQACISILASALVSNSEESVMLLALALDVRNGVRRFQSSLTSNALSMNRGLL